MPLLHHARGGERAIPIPSVASRTLERHDGADRREEGAERGERHARDRLGTRREWHRQPALAQLGGFAALVDDRHEGGHDVDERRAEDRAAE